MTNPIAEFREISKTYTKPLRPGRTIHALSDVTLTVASGEVLALLGPNRAGKTTLLKILLGLCKPTSGHASRLGQPLTDRSTLARVGYMHENAAFPRYLSATSLLEFYGSLAGLSHRTLAARAPKLLDAVGLADRARQPISTFSKGMIQRLALAQALLAEPDLLVLDEPTEGLDLAARRFLLDTVAEYRQSGKTVIVVSHSLTEVAQMSDRVAVLVAGRLAHLSSLDPLIHDSTTGRTQSLEEALEPIYCS
jgi:ABC-2 type transport system ATP-binding protein